MSSPSSSRLITNSCTIDDTTMSNSNINTCNAGNVTDEGRVSCCPNSSSSSCGAANNKNNIADSRFSCNICFDAVAEPVVTRCGHLYCWPCLFRWLEPGMLPEERQSLGMSYVYNNNNRDVINRRECPVCKSECSLSSLVPVYVRSSIRDDDDDDDDDKDEKSLKNKNNKLGRTAIDDDKKISVRNGNSSDTNDDELDSGDGDGDEGDDSFINETPENGIGIDLDESLPVTNNGSSSDDGLRRRRNTNNNNNNNNNAVVPNRPSATNSPQQQPSSPVISSANNNNNNNNNNNSPPPSSSHSRSNGWITPRSPNGHNASLTHGILLSFQRATAEYYRNSNNHNTIHSNQYDQNQQQIPSLHDRRNPSSRNNNNNNNGDATSSAGIFQEGQQQVDVNSETTQYLSRLLIMLTSFVILCLLLV